MVGTSTSVMLSAGVTEAEVISSIEDFLFGDGDYLEREHRLLARKCGLNEGKIAGLWQKAAEMARQNLAPMQARFGAVAGRFDALPPKIEEVKRKLAEPKQVEAKPALSYRRDVKRGSASFILPAPQPTVNPTHESQSPDTAAADEPKKEQADDETVETLIAKTDLVQIGGSLALNTHILDRLLAAMNVGYPQP